MDRWQPIAHHILLLICTDGLDAPPTASQCAKMMMRYVTSRGGGIQSISANQHPSQ